MQDQFISVYFSCLKPMLLSVPQEVPMGTISLNSCILTAVCSLYTWKSAWLNIKFLAHSIFNRSLWFYWSFNFLFFISNLLFLPGYPKVIFLLRLIILLTFLVSIVLGHLSQDVCGFILQYGFNSFFSRIFLFLNCCFWYLFSSLLWVSSFEDSYYAYIKSSLPHLLIYYFLSNP